MFAPQWRIPGTRGGTTSYALVGVIEHNGKQVDKGHYWSFCALGTQWFKFNDTVVTEVSLDQVLDSQAYILFYKAQVQRTNLLP